MSLVRFSVLGCFTVNYVGNPPEVHSKFVAYFGQIRRHKCRKRSIDSNCATNGIGRSVEAPQYIKQSRQELSLEICPAATISSLCKHNYLLQFRCSKLQGSFYLGGKNINRSLARLAPTRSRRNFQLKCFLNIRSGHRMLIREFLRSASSNSLVLRNIV